MDSNGRMPAQCTTTSILPNVLRVSLKRRSTSAALPLEGEHQHGQLGLRIGRPGLVAALPLQIVDMDRAAQAVGPAAQVDDARLPPFLEHG
jgi:hypothetical protein